MKITITFDELDLKDNLVLSTINNLFNRNKAITGNIEVKPTNDTPFEDCEFVEDVTKQKKKIKTKEERVAELCDFANGKWKSLNEKEQKSLKAFVEFYKKKIMQQDFNINIANQWQKWWQNDKNNR